MPILDVFCITLRHNFDFVIHFKNVASKFYFTCIGEYELNYIILKVRENFVNYKIV